jgi:hypothetical protein
VNCLYRGVHTGRGGGELVPCAGLVQSGKLIRLPEVIEEDIMGRNGVAVAHYNEDLQFGFPVVVTHLSVPHRPQRLWKEYRGTDM